MHPVPDKPTSPDESSDLDAGWGEDDSGVSERPTVAPPFDLESYAKDQTAPSSDVVLNPEKLRRDSALPKGLGIPRDPLPSSLEDRIDQLFSDEHTARAAPAVGAPSDTAITMPPPAPVPEHITGRLSPPGPDVRIADQETPSRSPTSEPMSRRETPRGVDQIEVARAL
jgi:hypothetical protein